MTLTRSNNQKEAKIPCCCNTSTHQMVQDKSKHELDSLIAGKCKEYLATFAAEIRQEMQIHVDKLKSELESAKQETAELREALKTSRKDQVEGKSINNQASEAAKLGVKEIQEREARAKNIVFFNVPESKNDKNQDEEDVEFVDNLCKDVLKNDFPYSKIVRLGKKKENHTRPVRITLESRDQHEALLKSAKNLRNFRESQYKEISIRPDLTPLERQDMRVLVQEKKKKQAESDLNKDGLIWIIRNWKVISINRKPNAHQVQTISE